MKKYNIAIVGASGMVGRKFIEILEESNIEINNLYLFASIKSKGKIIRFKNQSLSIMELKEKNIENLKIDYALFSAGGEVSKAYANIFVKYGAIVVDNSSAWRMDENVPLVVPEINIDDAYNNKGIIANPNCSTIQSVLPLKVLDENFGLKSVTYTTYQAVSGSGIAGVKDLEITSKGEKPINYPYPIYNNCIPQIDEFLDNGYTKEEMKMILETRKILSLESLEVTATCVRVPVVNGHSVEIYCELNKDFCIEDIKSMLSKQDGIIVRDNPLKNEYPLATIASGTNDVFVGRIRKDFTNNKKLHLFCTADNIRKGAALNAVQIVKGLIKRRDLDV